MYQPIINRNENPASLVNQYLDTKLIQNSSIVKDAVIFFNPDLVIQSNLAIRNGTV
jgi:hypothetical protein